MEKINSRQEFKFLVSKKELMSIELFNKKHTKELYPEREILSLYMDTNNLELYKLSSLNDVEKFKVRYRTYPNTDLNIYQEVKTNTRFGKEKFVTKTDFSDLNHIALTYNRGYILYPTMFVGYKRKYLQLDNSVRLTIDSNINYFLPKFRSLDYSKIAIPHIVLEMKNLDNQKIDLTKYFFSNPVAFSKYNFGIEKLFSNLIEII
jgi:hypothetical protein